MNLRFYKFYWLIFLVSLLTYLLIQSSLAATPQNSEPVSGTTDVKNSAKVQEGASRGHNPNQPLEKVVSELSDEQVRRMLIQELQKQTQQSIAVTPQKDKLGGIASFIKKIRFMGDMIQWRIYSLKSSFGKASEKLPHFFYLLGKDEAQKKQSPPKAIISVIGLFIAGFIVYWFVHRLLSAVYRRIETNRSSDLKLKIVGSGLQSMLDLISMCIFTIVILALFYVAMERTEVQSLLSLTYLTAFLIIMGARVVLRFFLSPKSPELRFLPLDDHTALYLFRWIMAIAIVSSFGLLTSGILRVAGLSEAKHLMMVASVELVITAMMITMILQKRGQVKYALIRDLPETGLRAQLANIWHYLAILALLFLWLISIFNLLLFGVRPGAPGFQTLLIIPMYFLLDWVLKGTLKVAILGSLKSEGEPLPQDSEATEVMDSAIQESGEGEEASDTEAQKSDFKKHMNVDRISRIIGGALRFALMVFVILYLLNIWGLDFKFGKAMMRGAFSIIIVALIFYVAWELFSAAIRRRLSDEAPDIDEEMEEGGAGGSRVGTLLLLLQKFIFAVLIVMATLIVLSSIGVNIGPLIAGAGVVGLAIGFGAQTLVKDIISGVFFMIDDAFRVGDYIETAGTKGMVEHISLRSLRLRHPRGMVNTIPFGDIGIVTNMSRDYIITKLDFRVRYDTDVDLVRKIIKKNVYEPIMNNEELAPKLLDSIKSQGIREMDDSAMIMRIKYKTRPGEQFAVRKEVYRLMQEAFREAGIEFAHRNVTVYMPPETAEKASSGQPDQEEKTGGTSDQKLTEKAAAAAAVAIEQNEEDQKKPK
ncbi:MAG: mechanosensitive ion channel [Desulfobacterales bacterium]|jgi:small-conductance mechanosensitive channel